MNSFKLKRLNSLNKSINITTQRKKRREFPNNVKTFCLINFFNSHFSSDLNSFFLKTTLLCPLHAASSTLTPASRPPAAGSWRPPVGSRLLLLFAAPPPQESPPEYLHRFFLPSRRRLTSTARFGNA